MTNDNLVVKAKVTIRQINSNTSVSKEQTKADLESLREELDMLIEALSEGSDDKEGNSLPDDGSLPVMDMD